MSLEPLPTRQLLASLFAWLSTGFGTWLLIPAWWSVLKGPEAPIEPTTGIYFAAWLAGDFAHLIALYLESVGWQSYALYFIIAGAEIIILLTMAWKAHLFRCCQTPLPKSRYPGGSPAVTGFILVPATPAKQDKRKSFGGLPPIFWTVLWTLFFMLLSVAVWFILSFKRLANLPEPRPLSWPHDVKSQIAFGLGILGFFCWTGPRAYCLYRKKDEIDTSSVVLGVGAHTCNMLGIGILNFVTIGNAAAASPFFLTSLCSIVLDLLRLYRKRLYAIDVSKTFLAPALGVAQPAFVTGLSKGDLDLREEGHGTKKQKEEVLRRYLLFKQYASRLIEELESLEHDERIPNGDREGTLQARWVAICEKEAWNPATGNLLGKEARMKGGRLRSEMGTLEDQASALQFALKLLYRSDTKEYVDKLKPVQAKEGRVHELKNRIMDHRYTRLQLKTSLSRRESLLLGPSELDQVLDQHAALARERRLSMASSSSYQTSKSHPSVAPSRSLGHSRHHRSLSDLSDSSYSSSSCTSSGTEDYSPDDRRLLNLARHRTRK